MRVRYYIDPETGLPHIYRHGIREDEVEDILANRAEEYPARGGLRIAAGQTTAGRYVRVVYRPGAVPEVVTAYQLRDKDLAAFRRRMRLSGRRRR